MSLCASSIYTYSRCDDDDDDVSVCVCMITSSKKKKLYLQHWSTSHQTTDREHFFSHLYCRFAYIQSSNVLIIITSKRRRRKRGKPQSTESHCLFVRCNRIRCQHFRLDWCVCVLNDRQGAETKEARRTTIHTDKIISKQLANTRALVTDRIEARRCGCRFARAAAAYT